MKVLIAEDDFTSRTMLVAITRKWGYEPVAVEDGEAAWNELQKDNSPRLLLLDWEMPLLNGLGLCKRIRSQSDSKPFNNIELKARLQVGKRILDLQTELNQTKEMLTYQASHDALTGLLNRRAIMEGLEKEIARAQRQQQPLCVALCDIDYFKRINDRYGHLAGDYVLREVSQHITEQLRPFDLVGRYGGEEFLLILNAAKKDTLRLFERVRLSIENAVFSYAQQKIKVTISCGVTVFKPTLQEGESLILIDTADKALFSAKEGGRNRVVFPEADQ